MPSRPFVLTKLVNNAGSILQLTLNQPARFNVLSSDMINALREKLSNIGEEVRVVILSGGVGGRVFCAGHDLKEIAAMKTDKEALRELFTNCTKLMVDIQKLEQPVVASVDGVATAAGLQLLSSCDLAYATQHSRFAVSGVNYGLFCSTPSVGLSRNMASRKQAMEMLLTGGFIDASTAVHRGFINRCFDTREALDCGVMDVCVDIASKPRAAISIGKRLFYQQLEAPNLVDAYRLATDAIVCNALDPDAQVLRYCHYVYMCRSVEERGRKKCSYLLCCLQNILFKNDKYIVLKLILNLFIN